MRFFNNKPDEDTACQGTRGSVTAGATTGGSPKRLVAPLPFGPSSMQSCSDLFEEDSGITGVFYPDDPERLG